ncbi:hypothetical protein NliqN6_4384 [Naganishia liquefaciens]|uniref:ADF-H domain-containing protein n=1 Tax=Naganishia liquefaciens TaxID=104408 RepID=A0A8H3TVN8_9TREE|nr:hypothetical protein NliqN6_4384 [Naganishia liquefaciens]
MSTNSVDLPAATKDAIRKFRFKRFKGDAALVVKIDKKSLTMVVDEQLEGSLEEIAEELPENAPRYVILSHPLTTKDGRLTVPLVLINWAPSSSPTELMMLHTSGLPVFQQAAECARVIEMREGAEDFTEEFINAKLQ